jgi:hypothetical protein
VRLLQATLPLLPVDIAVGLTFGVTVVALLGAVWAGARRARQRPVRRRELRPEHLPARTPDQRGDASAGLISRAGLERA